MYIYMTYDEICTIPYNSCKGFACRGFCLDTLEIRWPKNWSANPLII